MFAAACAMPCLREAFTLANSGHHLIKKLRASHLVSVDGRVQVADQERAPAGGIVRREHHLRILRLLRLPPTAKPNQCGFNDLQSITPHPERKACCTPV